MSGVLRFRLRGAIHHASLLGMDTRYYTSAARITPGTRINVDGAGTLEVASKTRQVNGLYRIRTREVYGEHPCNFLDVYPARHVFELAAGVN